MFIIKPISVQAFSGHYRQAYKLIELTTALCFGVFSTEQRAQHAMEKHIIRQRKVTLAMS